MSKKNIVICSDGTGNTAVKGRGTNVFKLYEAVDVVGHLHDESKREQVAIYDDGVGTQSLKLIRVLAGAFGFGLARNVRQLYAELIRSYSPGDDIYMFGFSRGAFTVRTLAGFVDSVGILNPQDFSSGALDAVVGDLYRGYRKKKPAWIEWFTTPLSSGSRRLWRAVIRFFTGAEEKKNSFHFGKKVKFVGVWDTVDAVGFPVPVVATIWNTVVHRFKFNKSHLPGCVEKACHALAIDEERASFAPTLWDHESPKTEQVWFAGVHSNVGGGYPKQGMSLVALDWMMDHAEQASGQTLRFAPGLREQYREGGNVGGNLYDSRSGPAIYYRYRPRDIQAICKQAADAPVRVHHTAISRIMRQTRGYSPGNLPNSFEIVGRPGVKDSKVVLETAPPEDEVSKTLPEFSGANGFWKWWRQSVQVAFYIAQAGLVWLAVSNSPVPENELPKAPVPEQAAVSQPAVAVEAGDRVAESAIANASPVGGAVAWLKSTVSRERLVPWLMAVAENAVAAVPGSFVQERLVQPMFAYPKIGLAFVLVFPLCFALGLFGRLRQEAIDSNQWRHLRIIEGSGTESDAQG